jgi:hypothetical protein
VRRIFRFGLVLCVLFHAAGSGAARSPKRLIETAAPDGGGIQKLTTIPSSVYPYYQTLKQYSFEPAGAADPQGWTTHDLTAQPGVYWHVDDFSGLSGWVAPISGLKSMWCGVRTSTDPAYVSSAGYGNYWTQILESDPVAVTPGRPVGLLATVTYDVEQDYDFIYIEYKSNGGPWTTIGTLNGAQPTPTVTGWAADGANVGSTIQFRFVMTSDFSVSDEDGQDTHGAMVIDDVRIVDALTNTNYNVQNFESASVNATAAGIWHGVTPPPFGNYAGLVSGSNVHQIGTPNNTFMWSFFNGSSATYACGGYPSQAAVPYTTSPGSTRPGDYIDNELRSPWIDLSVDKNNQPANPDMGAVVVELDAYLDPENASNYVTPFARARFMINGAPQPWQFLSVIFTAGGWVPVNPLRGSAWALIPAGATHVQIALGVMDDPYEFGGAVATCHTPAPLYDNISVRRIFRPFRVSNSNDSGSGSLRQAITNANSDPDFNLIFFSLPGSGPFSINVGPTPLPAVTHPVWIDGFTQAGSSPNTQQGATNNAVMKIMLHGADAGIGANGLEFSPGSVGVVRGLIISSFSGAGILSQCNSLEIQGCWFGMDHGGVQAFNNGIAIHALTQGIDIGGIFNEERVLIGSTTGDGIRIDAGGAAIFNTHCGYDPQGNPMPTGGPGIHVTGGTSTQIGTPANAPCAAGTTSRNRIGKGGYDAGIIVDTAASGVSIYQPWLEGMLDLGNDGPNPNDPLDADSGANGLQNHPELIGAGVNTISGNMDGLPNTPHHIEFFSGAPYYATPNYLGYQDVTTDGSGHASISFACNPIAPGSSITALATANNNTSELGTWVLSFNTPPGSPSPPVNLYDAQQQLRATVQYDNVFSPGNTLLTQVTPSSVPIPALWNVGATPQYWDITANVAYSGNVHVCLNYDPAQVPAPEGSLRLLHYQNGQWVNVTTSVDVVNNQICGVVSSLSPFVIAKPTNATGVGDAPLPVTFALRANVPNPFNPITTIAYDVPQSGGDVSISIFDVSGRLVRTLLNEHRSGGRYSEQWNGLDNSGRPAASGVYFYRMHAGSFNETRKMVLLK